MATDGRKSKYWAKLTRNAPAYMEDIVETITWPSPDRNYDYVRGHILSNAWGYKRWVALVFGYNDNPPDSQAFRYLPEARRWACSVIRQRNRQRRMEKLPVRGYLLPGEK
jgi:hypothetical protein